MDAAWAHRGGGAERRGRQLPPRVRHQHIARFTPGHEYDGRAEGVDPLEAEYGDPGPGIPRIEDDAALRIREGDLGAVEGGGGRGEKDARRAPWRVVFSAGIIFRSVPNCARRCQGSLGMRIRQLLRVPPQLLLLVVAVLASLVRRTMRSPPAQQVLSNDAGQRLTIFVCLVADRDRPTTLRRIWNLLRTASAPDCLTIGVVEKIQRMQDSVQEILPPQLRHRVLIKSTAQTILSEHEARALCHSSLATDQSYVLCLDGDMTMRGWDAFFLEHVRPDAVITAPNGPASGPPVFPFVKRVGSAGAIGLGYRVFQVPQRTCVRAVAWVPDLSFGTRSRMEAMLREERPTQRALGEGVRVLVPCTGVMSSLSGATATVRRGDLEVNSPLFEGGRATTHAFLGLSACPSNEEQIAKYGSISASRLAIEKVELQRSRRREEAGRPRRPGRHRRSSRDEERHPRGDAS